VRTHTHTRTQTRSQPLSAHTHRCCRRAGTYMQVRTLTDLNVDTSRAETIQINVRSAAAHAAAPSGPGAPAPRARAPSRSRRRREHTRALPLQRRRPGASSACAPAHTAARAPRPSERLRFTADRCAPCSPSCRQLDITLPHMACSVLSLDVMDVSGEEQLDVSHNMFKARALRSLTPRSLRRLCAAPRADAHAQMPTPRRHAPRPRALCLRAQAHSLRLAHTGAPVAPRAAAAGCGWQAARGVSGALARRPRRAGAGGAA
jgi:hypothetical protein